MGQVVSEDIDWWDYDQEEADEQAISDDLDRGIYPCDPILMRMIAKRYADLADATGPVVYGGDVWGWPNDARRHTEHGQ